jgi:hypothetical protein
MSKHLVLCATVFLTCSACDAAPPANITPEPDVAEQKQGLLPAPQRARTADTDRDQLRTFTISMSSVDPSEITGLVQGPFVVTSAIANFTWPLINFDGACPTYEEMNLGDESFLSSNLSLPLSQQMTVVVPEGAVLCVVRNNTGFGYSAMFSGYVPY